jgi:hypothetical protein
MLETVQANLDRAAMRGQKVGPEIEFFSNVSRTTLMKEIATRYRLSGFQVEEVHQPYFHFPNQSQMVIWDSRTEAFKAPNGDAVTVHYFLGAAGFIVAVASPRGISTGFARGGETDMEEMAALRLAAEMYDMSSDAFFKVIQKQKRTFTELLTVKSTDKDLFDLKLDYTKDSVILTGLSGQFLDAADRPVDTVTFQGKLTRTEVEDKLRQMLANGRVLKRDPVTTIHIDVPGRSKPLSLEMRYDLYPVMEIVPTEMAIGESATLLAPLLDFLESPKSDGTIVLEGTGTSKLVSNHVHREVPWTDAEGRLTIAHMLKFHRQWLQVRAQVVAAIPTLEARTVFAAPLPDDAAAMIADPEFFRNPTDPVETLDYMGLIVRNSRPKYHEVNPENWFGHHINLMMEQGLLRRGETYTSRHFKGVSYQVETGELPSITMTFPREWRGEVRPWRLPLIRIPGPKWIPTVELRSADCHLQRDYMSFLINFFAAFGHDAVGTASQDVAKLHDHIQRPGYEAIARDFARHPGLPLSIFSLLGHGIPELLVAYRLKGLVGEAAMTALAPYKAIAADPVVATVVDSIRAGGLAAVLGPDAQKDPIASALDNLLKAGANVGKLIDGVYLDGVIPSQNLGAEVEFNTSMARDPIYEMIADAYRQIPGATVTLDSGDGKPHFDFNAKSPLHWTISQPIQVNGQTIVAKVASGTGGFIISAIRTIDDAKMRAAKAQDVLGALHEAQGLVAEMVGTPAPVHINDNPHFLMMCKSNDGDYLKMDVTFNEGKATLTALNGSFVGNTGPVRILQIPAHNLDGVEQFLQANARTKFAQKDNKIKVLQVHIPGLAKPFELKLVYEEHPFLEAVTGIVNARTTDVMTPYLDALSKANIDGNRSGNPLAFQVHAELPYLDAHGKMTVAAFLQLQRNFAAMADSFSAVLAPDPNRIDFAKVTPDAYLQRISASNYVDDPTRLTTMLNVVGDFVDARPTKYQDMNADHFASWFLRTLIQQGTLQLGQKLTTEWHGQAVTFSVRADVDGSPQIFRGTTTNGGFKSEQPMIRISAHQPTVELRLPNALFAPNGGTAGYVNFLMQLTTAFVQTHAQIDSKTIAPGKLGPIDGISRLIAVTRDSELPSAQTAARPSDARLPSSQRGFVTVDGMLNIATLGAVAAVEKIVAARSRAIATTAEVARGGAIFLAGDVGSDLVLGDWERLKNLSLAHVAKDYALLTVGGEPARMAAGSIVSKLPISAAFKAFATRATSLLGAITAQQYGNTGTVDVGHLPESVASIMTASALVQGSVMVMGQVETLSNLGKVLRLAKLGGGATGWGLVVTSVAEFALIKTFGKIMEDADETQRLTALTDSVGTLLTTASAIPAALAQKQDVNPGYMTAVRGQLDDVIAALDQSLTLEERRVWAQYQTDVADLKTWYRGEMGRTLDGTFSYSEIEETHRARQAALLKSRDQDLAALAIQNSQFTRLPVGPGDDYAAFVDAVDENQLKADVDMDGNPRHEDPTALRYQALLHRNPHVLVAQLKQFRADWEDSLKNGASPKQKPGLPLQVLAQR